MTVRIQMSRRHPWRHLHPDAVIVTRGTRWGNPHTVTRQSRKEGGMWVVHVALGGTETYPTRGEAHQRAVDLFTKDLRAAALNDSARYTEWLAPLVGKDLACWCPPTDTDGSGLACHGDVLLKFARRAAP